MIYGMLQNRLQGDLVHNIGKGAVESEREFIGEALPGALEEPILIGEGLHTQVACMI